MDTESIYWVIELNQTLITLCDEYYFIIVPLVGVVSLALFMAPIMYTRYLNKDKENV